MIDGKKIPLFGDPLLPQIWKIMVDGHLMHSRFFLISRLIFT
jgi:hypothetical protein